MPWKKKQHHFRGVARQFLPVKSEDSVLSNVAVCTVNVVDSDVTYCCIKRNWSKIALVFFSTITMVDQLDMA